MRVRWLKVVMKMNFLKHKKKQRKAKATSYFQLEWSNLRDNFQTVIVIKRIIEVVIKLINLTAWRYKLLPFQLLCFKIIFRLLSSISFFLSLFNLLSDMPTTLRSNMMLCLHTIIFYFGCHNSSIQFVDYDDDCVWSWNHEKYKKVLLLKIFLLKGLIETNVFVICIKLTAAYLWLIKADEIFQLK